MKRTKAWATIMVAATAVTGVAAASAWIQASANEGPSLRPASAGVIIGYKSQAAEAGSDDAARRDVAAKAQGRGFEFSRRLATGGVLVDLPGLDQAAVDAAMRVFRADPDVAYVEPNSIMHAMLSPNDPEYPKQWHYSEDKAGMRVPGAWDSSTGSGVTVAVIDTGYVAHSDLADNIVAGYDFISNSSYARDNNGRDSNPADEGDWGAANECGWNEPAHNSTWHGTHVAGTIAARTDNGKGVAGVAPNAKIQPVRVLGKCGGTVADIADAIVWASGGTVNGVPANQTPAKIINMSLGGEDSCPNSYQNAINGAVQRGSTIVVAAGNSNQDASRFNPANCSGVITVAGTDRDGNRAQFRSDGTAGSNYGTTVDIAAPGGETWTASDRSNGILSTLNSSTTTPGAESYAFYQGTSMATPHVAGLAALMKSKKPDLTPAQIEKLIKDNSRPLPGTCSGGCGAGLADATKTMAALGDTSTGAVSVTNPGDQSTVVNKSASLQIKASTTNANASLSYSATGLPSGLTISSSSGLISGTPTATGTSSVKVTVTDSTNATNSASFSWTVTSGTGGTVTVTKPQDQWGFTGWTIQPLQIQASSTAGGSLTFTASGLPTGLSISSSGQITGTPTAGGAHTVTITAKDSGGSTGTTTFAWQIYGF
ncbi:S8 family serine peptidase [Lentzea sp. NPDC051838]|uniref:S8 family serine peptidase n=1 Tax=Lentzea sp. NPDC051838 TaxID=3154849 RepID=UPI003424217D